MQNQRVQMIIYNFIKYLILSIKYNRILQKVYREEGIIEGLSKLFGTEFRQDWIGRIYTIINPHVVAGVFDPGSTIYEFGSDNPTEMAIEKFIMDKLNAVRMFVKANNLFDLLTYKIEKEDDYDNYLFVMFPIPYLDLAKWTKWLLALIILLVIIGVVLLMIF